MLQSVMSQRQVMHPRVQRGRIGAGCCNMHLAFHSIFNMPFHCCIGEKCSLGNVMVEDLVLWDKNRLTFLNYYTNIASDMIFLFACYLTISARCVPQVNQAGVHPWPGRARVSWWSEHSHCSARGLSFVCNSLLAFLTSPWLSFLPYQSVISLMFHGRQVYMEYSLSIFLMRMVES